MDTAKDQVIRQEKSGRQPVSLVIPCRAEYIGLCRLVAGVLGAREGLGEEDIADLKVVVTEACTCFMWGPDGPPLNDEGAAPADPTCTIRVDFDVLPESWELSISDPDRRSMLPRSGRCETEGEGGLGLTIMRALVDSMEHTDTEAEGSIIRLLKRLSAEDVPTDRG